MEKIIGTPCYDDCSLDANNSFTLITMWMHHQGNFLLDAPEKNLIRSQTAIRPAYQPRFIENVDQLLNIDGFDKVMLESGGFGQDTVVRLPVSGQCD